MDCVKTKAIASFIAKTGQVLISDKHLTGNPEKDFVKEASSILDEASEEGMYYQMVHTTTFKNFADGELLESIRKNWVPLPVFLSNIGLNTQFTEYSDLFTEVYAKCVYLNKREELVLPLVMNNKKASALGITI